MLFSKTDKLFEDAGKDPEQMEKLLRRLRRVRSVAFIIALILLLAFFALSAWFLIESIAMLRSGTFKMSPALKMVNGTNGIRSSNGKHMNSQIPSANQSLQLTCGSRALWYPWNAPRQLSSK